jgi:hypothetical protein
MCDRLAVRVWERVRDRMKWRERGRKRDRAIGSHSATERETNRLILWRERERERERKKKSSIHIQ